MKTILAPDGPAAAGPQAASAMPEPDGDVPFDYELRDPMQPWATAAILLLSATVLGFVAWLRN